MSLSDIVGGVGRLTKAFNTIEQRVERLTEDVKELGKRHEGHGDKITDLTTRVAVLEEARKTTAAEARAAVAEAVADLKVRYTEAVADLRVKAAQDEAERRSAAKTLPPTSEARDR